MSACLRCKQQKLRCTMGETGCERCTRIGVQCVPAPPSRQGKRTRPADDGEPVAKVVGPLKEAVALISRLAKELGQGDSCAYLLLGFFRATESPPNDAITWLLCLLAELGTSRNSHGLFKDTLSLAATFNIPVSDVVGAMRVTGAPIRLSEDGPPAGLTLPSV